MSAVTNKGLAGEGTVNLLIFPLAEPWKYNLVLSKSDSFFNSFIGYIYPRIILSGRLGLCIIVMTTKTEPGNEA